jgi:hypothetical protein
MGMRLGDVELCSAGRARTPVSPQTEQLCQQTEHFSWSRVIASISALVPVFHHAAKDVADVGYCVRYALH